MASEDYVRTVFTDAIAEHLALRQRNAGLEQAMPLRDYLPVNYVRVDEPTDPGRIPAIRQWFDVEEDGGLEWAA
ncbi:MAG: hypothetical protein ACKO2Y_06780 [Actinomycetota bacterium]